MKIAPGKKIYDVSRPRAKAQGLSFTGAELETTLKHRLPPLLRDDLGRQQVQDRWRSLKLTHPCSDKLTHLLAA